MENEHLKTGSRVVVLSGENTDQNYHATGKVIKQTYTVNKGQLIKVMHDDGLENWYPADWVKPLLRLV